MTPATERLRRSKISLRYAVGCLYILAGAMHFVVPNAYTQVAPPVFPTALAFVYVSGVVEIALGIGTGVRRTQHVAAWGLITLLIVVFPANVYVATSDIMFDGAPAAFREPPDATLWLRLLFQGVLVAWAWWYTRPESVEADELCPVRRLSPSESVRITTLSRGFSRPNGTDSGAPVRAVPDDQR